MKLTDYLNAINHSKEPLLNDEMNEKEYVPYVINRCLSYFPDTIFYVNTLNYIPGVSKKMHFDYLSISLRKRKRFSKWLKKEQPEQLEAIKFFYGYSNKKAEETLSILSKSQLDEIMKMWRNLKNNK